MLTDDELSAFLMQKWSDSEDTIVKDQRIEAQERYDGELYGDEVEGQSSIVTTEVRDTIETLLPQVVEPFVESDNAVTFQALSAEDVEQAEVETAYVRHVIYEQNEGFLEISAWAKDGLLFKNGYVKSWWDEKIVEKKEVYKDKDFLFYQQLVTQPDIEVTEVTVTVGEDEYDLEGALDIDPAARKQAVFDMRCIRRTDESQFRFKAIPPENLRVEKNFNCVNIDDAHYVCHRDTKKAWELIEEGYDKAIVSQLVGGDDTYADSEKSNRFEGNLDPDTTTYDEDSNRTVTIYEHYVFADLDGSGKPQHRMIVTAGSKGKSVLSNEEIDDNPFSVWTPSVNPHKHSGTSTADLTLQNQLIKTNLVRRTMDSLYHSIYTAKGIVEGNVYKEDLLYTGPGAIYRVREGKGAVADNIVPISTPFVGQAALPVIAMVDEMRAMNTGVSGSSQGLDLKSLADSTNLVAPMLMSQDLARVKMVLRNFAETGIKHLMKRCHKIVCDHDRVRMFEYNGEFREVNPQQWSPRKHMKVNVGVGYVEKMQKVTAVNTIVANQTGIVTAAGFDNPLVDAVAYRKALVDQAKLSGITDADKYYNDPANWQPAPKEDALDQAVEVEKAKAIADVHKQAADNALKKQIADDDRAFDERKFAAELQYRYDELQQKYDTDADEKVLRYGSMARDADRQLAAPSDGSGQLTEEALIAQLTALQNKKQQDAERADADALREQETEMERTQREQMDDAYKATQQQLMVELIGKLGELQAALTAPKQVVIKRDGQDKVEGAVVVNGTQA